MDSAACVGVPCFGVPCVGVLARLALLVSGVIPGENPNEVVAAREGPGVEGPGVEPPGVEPPVPLRAPQFLQKTASCFSLVPQAQLATNAWLAHAARTAILS